NAPLAQTISRRQIHARSGRADQAIAGALPGRGGGVSEIRGRGPAWNRGRNGCDAGRSKARRRIVRPPDAVRQALLPRSTRRGRQNRLAARHLWTSSAVAATAATGWVRVVFV